MRFYYDKKDGCDPIGEVDLDGKEIIEGSELHPIYLDEVRCDFMCPHDGQFATFNVYKMK